MRGSPSVSATSASAGDRPSLPSSSALAFWSRASVSLTVRIHLPLDDLPRAIERLRGYRDVGVDHVVAELVTADLEQAGSLMRTLAQEVWPRVVP